MDLILVGYSKYLQFRFVYFIVFEYSLFPLYSLLDKQNYRPYSLLILIRWPLFLLMEVFRDESEQEKV